MSTRTHAAPRHNPLATLGQFGQSVWLDFLRRSLIESGELKRMIDEDALTGVTSNPAIFEKAIDSSNDYAGAIEEISTDPHLSAKEVFEILAVRDIQDAADVLRPVYERTAGRDGYVSLEVAPDLANDTQATIDEARRLWTRVSRPSLMIKVPATAEGLPAIRALLRDGINVNITLLFARSTYEAVARAYLDALTARASRGERVDSVASFFVSRIDSAVDTLLAAKLKTASASDKAHLEALVGKIAIANAKLAYQSYRTIFSGAEWEALRANGAQTQRVLWASTGTKDPTYRDVLYVEELIGPETVNTIPPATLTAFRNHGRPRASLDEGLAEAVAALDRLEQSGISLKAVSDDLLTEGPEKFREPFAKLITAIERRCREANRARLNAQRYTLPPALAGEVARRLKDWDRQGGTRRLWAGDASLWTGHDESDWIGWIGIVESQLENLTPLRQIQAEVRQEGFSHALLLGMGGSSPCPEVWKETFGRVAGSPELFVLDSSDPAQVKMLEETVDLHKTLFIVSSKSGSTLEPHISKAYFWDRVTQAVGPRPWEAFRRHHRPRLPAREGGNSGPLPVRVARPREHRRALLRALQLRPGAGRGHGPRCRAAVGRGRPDAARLRAGRAGRRQPGPRHGHDPRRRGERGRGQVDARGLSRAPRPGRLARAVAGGVHRQGGKGIIPVDRERVGAPDVYGDDRLFAYLRLETAPDAAQDAAVEALEQAGRPVVRIHVTTQYDLAEEFLRWEIATAIAGAVLGINPFDQPDVEASKIARLRAAFPAFDRPGLQGRAGERGLRAGDLR